MIGIALFALVLVCLSLLLILCKSLLLRFIYTRPFPALRVTAVPLWFRLAFHLKNNAMAIGTVLLLIILSHPVSAMFMIYFISLFGTPLGQVLFMLLFVSMIILARVWMVRKQDRGVLDFAYREWFFKRTRDSILYKHMHKAPLPSVHMFTEKYEGLLKLPEADDALRFNVHAKLAEAEMKDANFQTALRHLMVSHDLFPKDAIINYRMGQLYELIGDADKAAMHHGAAQEDPTNSDGLNEYFKAQLVRVRAHGPRQYDWRAGLSRGS